MIDWQERWKEPGSRIFSGYGTQVTPEQMLDIILDRENSSDSWNTIKMQLNGAVLGPRGCYRGTHHSHFAPPDDETYDLVEGEFC